MSSEERIERLERAVANLIFTLGATAEMHGWIRRMSDDADVAVLLAEEMERRRKFAAGSRPGETP